MRALGQSGSAEGDFRVNPVSTINRSSQLAAIYRPDGTLPRRDVVVRSALPCNLAVGWRFHDPSPNQPHFFVQVAWKSPTQERSGVDNES